LEALMEAMQADGRNVATSRFQLPWESAVADRETALEKLKKLTLGRVAECKSDSFARIRFWIIRFCCTGLR
jgi:hypothetical protein